MAQKMPRYAAMLESLEEPVDPGRIVYKRISTKFTISNH